MIKIYSAEAKDGKLNVQHGIETRYGLIRSNPVNGFGDIMYSDKSVKNALYCYQTLKSFLFNCAQAEMADGFIDELVLFNIIDDSKLDEIYKSGNVEEEAIMLIANNVYVYGDNIRRLFGRFPESGAYLLMPDNVVGLSIPFKSTEKYEVLQSKGEGKQLYLNKMSHVYKH